MACHAPKDKTFGFQTGTAVAEPTLTRQMHQQGTRSMGFTAVCIQEGSAIRTMNAHNSPFSAPLSTTDSATLALFCTLCRQRQDSLLLMKQLVQMIREVQKHRGMSMALLGGNTQFRDDFERLQAQLERRLLFLEAFSNQTKDLLSQRDQENLHSAWITIRHDWQEDSVIDNYELHCHLIEQLLGMLAALGKQLEESLGGLMENSNTPDSPGYPRRFRHLEVLHFTTRQMPAVVEQLGRIRALSTYAAAVGHCDPHHSGKLRYVIQCTRVNNEKLRHQTKRLESLLEKNTLLLNPLKSYEIKLVFLLNMVEQDVLDSRKITADSSRLFNVATDIIEVYFKVIDDGIHLLDSWHQQDVENWLTDT
jgi:hypothetical protein